MICSLILFILKMFVCFWVTVYTIPSFRVEGGGFALLESLVLGTPAYQQKRFVVYFCSLSLSVLVFHAQWWWSSVWGIHLSAFLCGISVFVCMCMCVIQIHRQGKNWGTLWKMRLIWLYFFLACDRIASQKNLYKQTHPADSFCLYRIA